MINWDSFDEQLLIALDNYVPGYRDMDEGEIQAILDDIFASMQDHQLEFYDEYFKYNFFGMDDATRSTFCGSAYYSHCVKNSLSDLNGNPSAFRDKYTTYKLYKDYFCRDLIEVKDFSDYQKFVEFVAKNKTFIVKENESSLGANISKITISDALPIKSAFFRVLQYGGCVCEEWIEQCEEMKAFNSSSLNTVRITTMYDDSGFYKIYAMLRTGRNGEIVDNASMGGIAAEVDIDTGIVVSDGYTKTHLEHFECHPDTGKKYKGFQIPRWNEAIDIIKELHKHCPVSKIVGWDMALTDDGWVLVEGNGKPNIDTIQLIHYKTFGCGLKDVIDSTIGRYKD